MYTFEEHLCRTMLSEVRAFSLLAESPWHLIFSWGNRLLCGIAQEVFMTPGCCQEARERAIRHHWSLCFAALLRLLVELKNKLQTSFSFVQFSEFWRENLCLSRARVSREVLLVCCFLASLLLQHGTISVYKFKATMSKEFGFQKLTLCI